MFVVKLGSNLSTCNSFLLSSGRVILIFYKYHLINISFTCSFQMYTKLKPREVRFIYVTRITKICHVCGKSWDGSYPIFQWNDIFRKFFRHNDSSCQRDNGIKKNHEEKIFPFFTDAVCLQIDWSCICILTVYIHQIQESEFSDIIQINFVHQDKILAMSSAI